MKSITGILVNVFVKKKRKYFVLFAESVKFVFEKNVNNCILLMFSNLKYLNFNFDYIIYICLCRFPENISRV
jgi:hypothetical protein